MIHKRFKEKDGSKNGLKSPLLTLTLKEIFWIIYFIKMKIYLTQWHKKMEEKDLNNLFL